MSQAYPFRARAQLAALGSAMAIFVAAGATQQPATQAGQSPENQPEPNAVEAKPYTWQDLLNKKPGAIENEKKAFEKETVPKRKQRMASVLLHLGVRDQTYFDYLANTARQTLKDETPWPILYDEEGNVNKEATNPAFAGWIKQQGFDPNDPRFIAVRGYDPNFLEWCRRNGKNPDEASHRVMDDLPDPWYHLAAAGDARAYDLLIDGLHSHNFAIAVEAAQGLAVLQDPRAIPELIATGRKLPGDVNVEIAISLLYFSDRKAQTAANEMAGNRQLFQLARAEAQEKGLKALLERYW